MAGGVLVGRFLPWLADPAATRELVVSTGPLAPATFVLVSAVSVVLAPIPGAVLAVTGGYLFGWLWGTALSLLGVTVGSVAALLIARRLGRPYVEHVVTPEALERFDELVSAHGEAAMFVAFLVPGLPDDALCFAAGLTPVPVRRFLLLVVVGRLPSYLLVSLVGSELAAARFRFAIVLLALLLTVSVAGYLYGERLADTVGRWRS